MNPHNVSRNMSGNASGIFADVPSTREESTSLKLVLGATIILFFLELIMMYHRHHFHNALVYIAVLSIFFLNYFDKYYMRFCLAALGVAFLLDFIWVIVHADVI